MIMDDTLLTPAQVAEMTGLTTGSLAQLRYLGRGPAFYRLGPRTIRYGRREVMAWIAEHRAVTTTR
ncbi:helix-turn-helix transcriptional regulator [Sinomonas atrocyanea]